MKQKTVCRIITWTDHEGLSQWYTYGSHLHKRIICLRFWEEEGREEKRHEWWANGISVMT